MITTRQSYCDAFLKLESCFCSSKFSLLPPLKFLTGKHKGELMTKEERTDTDKKRERRKKKIKQKLKQKAHSDKDKLVDLLNPGIGKKFNKEKMKKTLESVTKSRNVQKVRYKDGNVQNTKI